MITGISTACTFSRYETEDGLSVLKELGAQCCEIFLQTFYEYRPEFAKKYADRAEGVKVNSVHILPTNIEPQLMFAARRSRGDGFYWLDQIMRSAQLFGAGNYTFHGLIRKGDKLNDDFGFYAERLTEISSFCARYGVKLCLENVWWSLYNRPGIFGELKKRCPALSGVFDIKQARRSGYPYQMYISDMAGSISYVHLSDVDENGNCRLPGKGIYDFKDILKRLKDAGFDGSIIIEVYPDNYSDVSELKQSLDFLNEIIYKVK